MLHDLFNIHTGACMCIQKHDLTAFCCFAIGSKKASKQANKTCPPDKNWCMRSSQTANFSLMALLQIRIKYLDSQPIFCIATLYTIHCHICSCTCVFDVYLSVCVYVCVQGGSLPATSEWRTFKRHMDKC
jgi:hypothetical protein